MHLRLISRQASLPLLLDPHFFRQIAQLQSKHNSIELVLKSTMGSFICFYRIFRIFQKLEDPSSNFPNFRKAVFQFRISLAAVK